jgi:serine/threonine protein kinase
LGPDGRRSRAFLAKDLTGDRLQGTVEYAAPEVLADIGMSAPGKNGDVGVLTDGRGRRLRPDRPSNTRPEVDLWSTGVTVFIMLGGYHLFDASKESLGARRRMDFTLQREYDKPVWSNVSVEAKRVIQGLLGSDPGSRYTAERLLADRWLVAAAAAADGATAESTPPLSPRMSPRMSPRISNRPNGKMGNGDSPRVMRDVPVRVTPKLRKDASSAESEYV